MAGINNKIGTITDKFRSRVFDTSTPSFIIKTVTGNGYIDLTNAIENQLLELKAYGGISQTGEPTPDNLVDIVCNNGTIAYSTNLLDIENYAVIGYYINNSGQILESNVNRYYDNFIPVTGGTSIVWSTQTPVRYVSIMEYNDQQQFIKRTLQDNGSSGAVTNTLTLGDTTAFIKIGSNPGQNVEVTMDYIRSLCYQLEFGTIPTTYHKYSSTGIVAEGNIETIEDELGNIATAEILLAVGDIKDEQEILSGNITRKIGIKILDGTEGWVIASGSGFRQLYTQSTQGIIANSVSLYSNIAPYGCTASNRANYQFGCYSGGNGNLCFQMIGSSEIISVESRTQYLSNQYNNKTPVIVVYPLATESSQTVSSQILNIQNGTNRIEITQASINNLQLQAQYKATQ